MTGFNNMNQMEPPDYSGYFIGTVVDNNDPLKRQRIKALIPKLFEQGMELPWLAIVHSPGTGQYGGTGKMAIPELGSQVVVEFQNADPHYGIVKCVIPSKDYTPNAALLVNYPNRTGFVDKAGNLFWMDSTPGAREMHWEMPSGFFMHINNAGFVDINAPGGIHIKAPTTVWDTNTTHNGTTQHNGDYTHIGQMFHEGDSVHIGSMSIDGDTSITGSLGVAQNATIGGNALIGGLMQSATATIGGKSFAAHIHRAQGSNANTTPPL